MNRVTLILAETGSGKSSQVPQMLLEQGLSPILCTQPRRLAVVAVSKMVAQEQGCELGKEVGFHIGQMNRTSSSSKIVFQTAGVLLEEIKSKGVAALSRYKVVILDEVHERSVESDMVLCCIKILLFRNKNTRLVLMSATADFKRYETYFSDLGEKVEKVAVSNLSTQQLFQCSVKYLDQVVQQLGNEPGHLSVMNSLELNPTPFKNGTDIGMEIQFVIFDLIAHIHRGEPDREKGILVFLPTYRALEEQWFLLKSRNLDVEIFVLHSSIDIDQSIEAMEAYHSVRKVILATDVAESSITIPGASFVIDSCRCLEVYWNSKMKRDAPRIVWESHSQADQRKGRTGRTCNGIVYRMVPRSTYSTFNKFEVPAMQLLSLRKQVLTLFCAEARALNDALSFFDRCLNPPHPDTVHDAFDSLEALSALERDFRGKKIPTAYGKILAARPLSLEASMLVLEGSERGFLWESAVLASLIDTTPSPIMLPFGSAQHSLSYFQESIRNSRQSRQALLVGNLCAFEFWQRIWKDKNRLQRLVDEIPDNAQELEKEFCAQHQLSLYSLNAVAELSSCVFEVMHRWRPRSISLASGPPSYYNAYFQHCCCFGDEEKQCQAMPYLRNGVLHNGRVESDLLKLIVENHSRYLEPVQNHIVDETVFFPREVNDGVQCVFFRKGTCNRGNKCPYSHSLASAPAVCKFFSSGNGCRYGAQCRYIHDSNSSEILDSRVEFEDEITQFPALLFSLTRDLQGCSILLFGKETLSYVHRLRLPASSISVACSESNQAEAEKFDPSLASVMSEVPPAVQILWGLKPSSLTALDPHSEEARYMFLDWTEINCIVLSYPLRDAGDDVDQNRLFFLKLFEFMSVMKLNSTRSGDSDLALLLTMSTTEYSQCQVERAAREYFFFLESSSPVDSAFSRDGFVRPPAKLVTYELTFVPPPDVV